MTRPDRFDYVIVGGGSAGCVLANRLSADPKISVALLEAGPAQAGWRVRMPMAMGELWRSDSINWCDWSEAEAGLNGRRVFCPRGRILGGSSAINGMLHVRGHRNDFDGWAAQGCAGWGYETILPYFKRAESYEGGGDAYRGGEGPLRITRAPLAHPLDQAFLVAGGEAGYGASADFNGADQEGFGAYDRTISDGARVSAADAYLHPVLRRPNLTVMTDAQVTRLRLEGGRAVAVELGSGLVTAEREVVLCAGAVGSPSVLQRSGIGDRDRLSDVGIDPKHHLPGVGAGLRNHVEAVVQYACTRPVSLLSEVRPPRLVANAARWFLTRGGFCASNHWAVGAFLKSRAELASPDLQLIFFPLALKPGTIEPASFHGFQIHVGLQRSSARGEVTCPSADPSTPPRLRFDFLRDRRDLADLRRGLRIVREVVAQPAFDRFRGEETWPGAVVETDKDLDAWMAANADCSYHMTSSCRIGASDDAGAVVDPACRVVGLDGLRVVDASIMPEIVNSNTNAAVVMIAEKAAELILRSAT